ncbi:hypothetical protein MHBO_003518, partial [Bonamia ostreae]
MFEQQLRESNAHGLVFLENNNALNMRLTELNDAHEQITTAYKKMQIDWADETKESQDKLNEAHRIVTELQERLGLTAQKILDAETKTDNYSQQIISTMQ